jgi:hypothetical protein
MSVIDLAQHLRSPVMKPQALFSPTSLRYAAALRGNKSKRAGVSFTYAEAACRDAEKLICLAASNPEGTFYGFVSDEASRRTGEEKATQHGTFNVIFLVGSPSEILARIANGSSLPPLLDFLCCDESISPLAATERVALYDLAQKRLKDGGFFTRSYRSLDKADGALRFLVQELAVEMNDDQKQEFLIELKHLGSQYFAQNLAIAVKLNEAIMQGKPQSFFALFDGAAAKSETFEMMVAMGTRAMAYAGDAVLASNYVELAIPREAQDIIVKCRESILYEPIKDFALNRTVRSDIWIKTPSEKTNVAADLFGGFAYGVLLPKNQIPTSFAAQGKTIDLSSPLYKKLIALMGLMPMGIGDFLSHPSGKDEQPEKIIGALQILAACGIAIPMRGFLNQRSNRSVAQPRLVGNFNRYLDKTDLNGDDVMLASQALGCGVLISARDAFVMQALNRAGLSNSVSALMPELRRIAHTKGAHAILANDEPTPEMAQSLVRDVVGASLPQWYAYALLEAA